MVVAAPGASASSREAELEKLVGAIVAGRYRIERLLGAGGMGAVYAGEHLTTGRKVAIKLVDREAAESDLVVARFSREVRAMSAIESDHIPGVLDAGTHDDGRPFLVLDLLRGEDLGARLHREHRLPVAATLAITAQILRGLMHAHAAGVVHRDLKPDNVFLVSRPRGMLVKILDFGVSKFQPLSRTTLPLALTHRGVVLGTPFYIAPEQARSDADVDERADLYSVGAIVFECLAGRPPHVGETYEQVILAACTVDAPELYAIDKSTPEPVNRIVVRALSRDRASRFQSAREMLAALAEISPEAARIVDADSPEAIPSLRPRSSSSRSSSKPVIPWYTTKPVLIGTGILVLALSAVITLLILAQPSQQQQQPTPAIGSVPPVGVGVPPAPSSAAALLPLPVPSETPSTGSGASSASSSAFGGGRKPAPSGLDLQRHFE